MAGTAINPAPAGALASHAGNSVSPSLLNSIRITAVADRLAAHVCGTVKCDIAEFFNLCLSLSRGIDYAIANSEVPERAPDLPLLLKQVCRRRSDGVLQAAIMVLMISAKSACRTGWFSADDSEELLQIANEMGRNFCGVNDMNSEASIPFSIISKIMTRFYPRMKMGQILAFLEAKPGYGTFVIDFQIPKNAKSATEDKIRLFVAQTDNTETSSCIITPPQVSFLLNGKGVDRRTNVFMDTGPQIPTIVTHLLKYGTNLLQAVGQFNGNYIILVAFMSVVPHPDPPVLQEYVQPAVTAPDSVSDPEIIEGPSRISLNCPISFSRIKTPVKGHSCKHLQCFDFDNFVDINSRRPSWRCPHCNQYVCYADIRVDQLMVEVLREVGENVVDVLVSADGSWKAVMESNNQPDYPCDDTLHRQVDELIMQEPAPFSETVADVVDLTDGDDEMHLPVTSEIEDRKPLLTASQGQSNVTNPTILTSENQNMAPVVEDDFWLGVYLSSYGSGISDARSATSQIGSGVSEPAPINSIMSPVSTDAVSPAFNREAEAFSGNALRLISVPQDPFSAANTLQLQQSQFGNSVNSNEYGRFPSVARHVNRTPIAVQALPAQTQNPTPQQRSRSSLSNLVPNGLLPNSASIQGQSSAADGSIAVPMYVDRPQEFSRSHYPLQVSQLAPSLSQQPSATQNWDQQSRSIMGQPAPQVVGLPVATQPSSAYRVSPALQNSSSHQNLHQQRPLNQRLSHTTSQSPSLIRSAAQSPSYHLPAQTHLGGTQSGTAAVTTNSGQQARMMMARQSSLPTQMARQASLPTQTPRTFASQSNANLSRGSVGEQRGYTGGNSQSAPGAENLVDLTGEQNWRPTGRMRGSLSGQAYSAALSQFMSQPTQPALQTTRPPANLTLLPPPGIPSPLHVLMANNRNAHVSQAVNNILSQPASTGGSPGILPDPSVR